VESQRVALYKRIIEARSLGELDEVADEIRDRYGEVPRIDTEGRQTEALPIPVENLLTVAAIRILAKRHSVERIVRTPKGFRFYRRDIVRDYAQSVRRLIKNSVPVVYIDDPHCLEFEYPDWPRRRQLDEALAALRTFSGEVE
jgi:transcription-repair coupling factor (superfamily II helicase)